MLFTTLFCEAQHVSKSTKNNISLITECQGERIYLNSNNLIVSNEGMFLINDMNQIVALSLICCDAEGIYTFPEALESDLSVAAYPVWCETCMAWRVIGPGGRCGVCGNIP